MRRTVEIRDSPNERQDGRTPPQLPDPILIGNNSLSWNVVGRTQGKSWRTRPPRGRELRVARAPTRPRGLLAASSAPDAPPLPVGARRRRRRRPPRGRTRPSHRRPSRGRARPRRAAARASSRGLGRLVRRRPPRVMPPRRRRSAAPALSWGFSSGAAPRRRARAARLSPGPRDIGGPGPARRRTGASGRRAVKRAPAGARARPSSARDQVRFR